MIYEPVFEGGVNIAPVASLNKHLFYLTQSNDDPIYFTSTTYGYQYTNLHCVEIEGELYFREIESVSFETSAGNYSERDLSIHYGEYYDELIRLMITDKYSETVENKDGSTTTYNYGLFKVSDIVKLMKGDSLGTEQEFITFQPDDELIESISEYLENFRVTNDIAESNFAWTIDMCKLGYTPILVDFGEE